jgi:succinyl-diaminopimelate desuccinylase
VTAAPDLGDRALTLAQELVRIPTVAAGEAVAADRCAEVLAAAGWEVELVPFAAGRAQLIARTGRAAPDRCLCGHLDTVGTSEGSWQVDPFAGVVSDGALWGRGTADMKGGVGAILAAAESLAADHRRPGAAIILTAAEETGAEGAAAIAGRREVAAIREWVVAEPTGNRVLVAHRGALWLRLRARGRTGHASVPPADGGAIGELRRALDRVERLDFGPDSDPVHGPPTIALTGLQAGDAPNVLPGEAWAVLDSRFIAPDGVEDLLRRIGTAAGAEISVEVIRSMPAVDGSPTSALAGEAGALLSTGVQARAASYFTDLGPLAGPDSATVILGPGEPGQAHAVDERCSVEAIAVAAGAYRRLLAV